MTAVALWAAVVASYDNAGLVTLTNIRDRAATVIDTAVGEAAAQSVIDLWPAYVQEAYDAADALHVEAGIRAVIATLFERGGTSANIVEVKWEEAFGDDGILSKVRRTGARARQGPVSNSNVTQATGLTAGGARFRGWADRESLPVNFLPAQTSAVVE